MERSLSPGAKLKPKVEEQPKRPRGRPGRPPREDSEDKLELHHRHRILEMIVVRAFMQ